MEVPAAAVQAQMSALLGSDGRRPPAPASAPVHVPPVDFVCEDDVRQALGRRVTIPITERTIVTPSARDLGDAHGILVVVDGAARPTG
jgi:hypothetical protein